MNKTEIDIEIRANNKAIDIIRVIGFNMEEQATKLELINERLKRDLEGQ